MREKNISYTEVITIELADLRQKLERLESQFEHSEPFEALDPLDDSDNSEMTVLQSMKRIVSEREIEMKSSTATYITEELIRARAMDLRSGLAYSEVIQLEKESWQSVFERLSPL